MNSPHVYRQFLKALTTAGSAARICLVGLFAASLLLSPAHSNDQTSAAKRVLKTPLEWQPIYQGVDLAEIEVVGDLPCRGKALRIDVAHRGIQFVLTPGNGDEPGETTGMKTSTFARNAGCQIAINAAPFSPICITEGLPQDISGLHVVRGEIVSQPQAGFAAMLLSPDNVPTISAGPFEIDNLYNAVGGFRVVLRAGKVIAPSDGPRHPRTAAGISADRKFLFLLVVDGRQPKYSVGATTAEIGYWLKQLHADDGINLDGGGTSTLIVANENGTPEVFNRPIHAGIPGMERVGGSHLGVKALPLD